MDKKDVRLCDVEKNIVLEFCLSPGDAFRAENDINFATSLMNSALAEKARSAQLDQSDERNAPEELSEEHNVDSVASPPLASPTEVCPLSTTEENSDIEERGSSSLYRWTDKCVQLLLDSYKLMEDKLNSGKYSQKKIWDMISNIMQEQGYNITGPQCAAKLRSLKKTYKSIKDHNSKSGNNRRTWQFFEAVDEIFSKKAWCSPVALASSTGLSVKNNELGTSKSQNNGHCKESNSINSASLSTLLTKRLRQKEEHEEARAKRHKEKMEMDNKFLTILEKLANKQ